jgi:hypothetical protein
MFDRAINFDVTCPDEQYRAVRSSIDRFRAGCRQLFSVLGCAQAAGASLVSKDDGDLSLKPNTAAAQAILRQMFRLDADAKAKALAYPARRWWLGHVYPDAMSFVWDGARRIVCERWQAKDPEFTRANRGWLILQGARGVAEFQRLGIPFPQTTARPKLLTKSIALKWDRTIGEVEFFFAGRGLTPHEWHIWSKIRHPQHRIGVTYQRDGQPAALDPDRVLYVRLGDDGASLVLVGPDGERSYDAIGLSDAAAQLAMLAAQSRRWSERKECAGNPRKPWGFKKAWKATVEHLVRVTKRRECYQKDCNHAWSRRIVSRAASWRCGVTAFIPPDGLSGQPWQWTQLSQFLTYKLQQIGGVLRIDQSEEAATA